ncbi:hypothetical protein W97_08073 [Coniosporium apollinis CBS 100218]|uniref:Transcription factor domain-containing protein n=1 Tax=Coniosporium apollinis (strain CBS 100218) TaxID=1168221 RepID=R7Z3N8_CONA1|nr:uncharacterized protein W97_08073 [Coniosporium apollinis CBS 100218]EON68815.1 hypothetical protein W97_08073 [Coniosporium apollinis CBS 100218]
MSASDDTISSAHVSRLAEVQGQLGLTTPNELSVFIFCIRLRQITSRIHTAFFTGSMDPSNDLGANAVTLPGYIYVKYHHFMAELEDWRRSAPVFDSPNTLYERPEWYDFLLEKDKLSLIRAAMHKAPKRNGVPPRDLSAPCMQCAIRVIELYSEMLKAKYITWTRSYFQIMFTAGLSLMYCVSLNEHESKRAPQSGDKSFGCAGEALRSCSEVLGKFAQEMPDARGFAIVFEGMRKSVHTTGDAPSFREESSWMPPAMTATALQASTSGVSIQRASNPLNELQADNFLPPHFYGSIQGTGSGQYQLESQPHYTLESRTNDRDLISADTTDLASAAVARMPIASDGLQMSVDGLQEPFSAWPIFTDEIMERLEADLGEYAWGDPDGDAYAWNQL